MNKGDLIRAAAERASLSQSDVAKALDAITATIGDSLAKGDAVQIIGFGTFDVRHRSARKGRNPSTGEQIDIPASSSPGFKAGRKLKDSVQS